MVRAYVPLIYQQVPYTFIMSGTSQVLSKYV